MALWLINYKIEEKLVAFKNKKKKKSRKQYDGFEYVFPTNQENKK